MTKKTKGKAAWASKTLAFFVAVLTAGGLDVLNTWLLLDNPLHWQQVALVLVALTGIGLRLITKEPVVLSNSK